jgi:hypothetical protein
MKRFKAGDRVEFKWAVRLPATRLRGMVLEDRGKSVVPVLAHQTIYPRKRKWRPMERPALLNVHRSKLRRVGRFSIKQVEVGMEEEKEHTASDRTALKIALDHLVEDPKYYTKLKRAGLNPVRSVRKGYAYLATVTDPQADYAARRWFTKERIPYMRRRTRRGITWYVPVRYMELAQSNMGLILRRRRAWANPLDPKDYPGIDPKWLQDDKRRGRKSQWPGFPDEPICPRCKHYNAMLYDFKTARERSPDKFSEWRKCRDCGFVAHLDDIESGVAYRSQEYRQRSNPKIPKGFPVNPWAVCRAQQKKSGKKWSKAKMERCVMAVYQKAKKNPLTAIEKVAIGNLVLQDFKMASQMLKRYDYDNAVDRLSHAHGMILALHMSGGGKVALRLAEKYDTLMDRIEHMVP